MARSLSRSQRSCRRRAASAKRRSAARPRSGDLTTARPQLRRSNSAAMRIPANSRQQMVMLARSRLAWPSLRAGGLLELTAGPIGRDDVLLPANAVAAIAIPATHSAARRPDRDTAPATASPHSSLHGRDRIPGRDRHPGALAKDVTQSLFHVRRSSRVLRPDHSRGELAQSRESFRGLTSHRADRDRRDTRRSRSRSCPRRTAALTPPAAAALFAATPATRRPDRRVGSSHPKTRPRGAPAVPLRGSVAIATG